MAPIFLDDGPVLGSEMAAYHISYRVFPSEIHEGQRFQLKAELEKEARFMEAESLKKAKTV